MNTTRRNFLKTSLAGAAGLTIGMHSLVNATPTKKIRKLGLITGTVSDEMKKDYKATLRKIAEIGYDYIEGGVRGDSAEEYARFLKKTGLKPIAGGSSMYPMLQDLSKTLKIADELKYKYIVCYWPWTGSAENLSKDDFLKTAENLNKIGKKCKQAGYKFAFHNHDKEFKTFDGVNGFDILMENTDPDLVYVELDIYWIIKAGYQPVPFFKKYPGRFPLLHVKDMSDKKEQKRACPGSGIIDFPAIFKHSKTAGVKYYIVEQEACPEDEQLDCIKSSYDYLSQLTF